MAKPSREPCAVCKTVFTVTDETHFYAHHNKTKHQVEIEYYCSGKCSMFARKARRDAREAVHG
jgi:hypothetical protein